MIGFLRGILAEKGDGYLIVDVGGIGFFVNVPSNTAAYLKGEGEEVTLHTTMIVREDDMSLYGFSGKGELDAFNKLITVSGIGAKAGISILSSFTLEQLRQAIAFEDAKSLQKANGIGKKSAERIVLELKDKFSPEGEQGQAPVSADEAMPASGRSEAVTALMALGYSRGEAMNALASIKDQDLTTEEYVKQALKNLF